MPHRAFKIHKGLVASLFLILGAPGSQAPVQAQSIPTVAAVKATEQFVKIYDPKTSSIKVELKSISCEPSRSVSNPEGYLRVCSGNTRLLLSPDRADAIEQRNGITVLSFITANGLARARQASALQEWSKNLDLSPIVDAQAECLAGVYLKSALPVSIPTKDVSTVENYIMKIGSQSKISVPVSGQSPFTMVVNGSVRAMAFRYGFNSGDLESCLVSKDSESTSQESVPSRLVQMLKAWTASGASN